MNKYGIFLGCTVPVRVINYEVSFRKICSFFNIDLTDVNDFSCCGYPIKSVNQFTSLVLSARNLALAEKNGITTIITLCNACSEMLTSTNHLIKNNPDIRNEINVKLKEIGYEYNGTVTVKHAARFIYEDIGVDKLKEKVVKPLTGLKLAGYTGCHYTRPSDIYESFDSPEKPETLNEIIKALGAEPIVFENSCCGGGILGMKEETAFKMSNTVLSSIKENNGDGMILICPFCDVMFEQNQKKIEKTFNNEFNIPVLSLPQIIGIALGIPHEEIGLQINRIKLDSLLEKISEGIRS